MAIVHKGSQGVVSDSMSYVAQFSSDPGSRTMVSSAGQEVQKIFLSDFRFFKLFQDRAWASQRLEDLFDVQGDSALSSFSSSSVLSSFGSVFAPKEEIPEKKEEPLARTKAKLESSMDISPGIPKQLTPLLTEHFKQPGSVPGLYVFQNTFNFIFRLPKQEPSWIFKICTNEEGLPDNTATELRFNLKINDLVVQEKYNLYLLVFPSAKMIEVTCLIEDKEQIIKVIVEEFFQNVALEDKDILSHYQIFGCEMTLVFVQLAQYIALTGCNDIRERNCLVLNPPKNYLGNRSILMVDTDQRGDPSIGICGKNLNALGGLLGMVRTVEQVKAVLAEARRHNIHISKEKEELALVAYT